MMRWGYILLEDYLIYVCHLCQLGDEEAFKHVKLIHPIHFGGVSIFLLEKVGPQDPQT